MTSSSTPRSRAAVRADLRERGIALTAVALGRVVDCQLGREPFQVLGGRPEIFPVNYVVDHDGVVFRTEAGTKLEGAVGGPVAFEVDHLDRADRSGWSVILHGQASHVSPAHRHRSAHLALCPWTGTAKPHLVRVTPTTVTGRRIRGRRD